MASGAGRYSYLLRPLLVSIDVIILLAATLLITLPAPIRPILYIYILGSWFIITVGNAFYEVFRFTTLLKLIYLLLRQLILYTLVIFAFYGFIKNVSVPLLEIVEYISCCFISIAFVKIGVFNVLKKYRILLGQNKRRVIILGKNAKTQRLKEFFQNNPAYGYEFVHLYDLKKKRKPLKTSKLLYYKIR